MMDFQGINSTVKMNRNSRVVLLKYFVGFSLLFLILILVNDRAQLRNISVPPKNSRIKCTDKDLEFSFDIRGKYLILNNFIKATRQFKCNESITLTTPADFRFLDNIPPLVDAWRGPISVALYAPGYDFFDTLDSIAFLRNCAGEKVREFVTFHIFFEYKHIEQVEKSLIDSYDDYFNCSETPPFEYHVDKEMFKTEHQLLYPINVARNIARKNAQTYFVFPSDIELFPTPNFIGKFLDFVMMNIDYILDGKRRVFVLPIFEIYSDQKIPNNKTELQKMFKKKKAFWFHQKICKVCHKVIEGDAWLAANETKGIGVFTTGKRQEKYKNWEPFYVSNNQEPFFDERFTWEGESNKLIQAFTMCVLDYDFDILDNAFLVHKPGIKKLGEKQSIKYGKQIKATKTLKKNAQKELTNLFGEHTECL